MTIIWNFFKFVRGAILMIKRNGLSGIGMGYRYWINTSPFIAQVQYYLLKKHDSTKEHVDNFAYDSQSDTVESTQSVDVDLRKELQKRYSNLDLEIEPHVCIIICTFDQVSLLEKCLRSIETKTTYKNYEILIVTNNADANSQMRKFLSKQKHTVKIYEGDYSFAAINNFGATDANGDFYLFLNDDTEIISEKWIESLLLLGVKKDVGAVGGKLLNPNGKLQEAGSIIWRNGNAWNYGKDAKANDYQFNFVREVDYCSASLLLVKKVVFVSVGGFDTRYTPAYWEDTDLCLKIKEHGFKVLYQPLCAVIHVGGQSNSTLNKNLQSALLENKKKFIEKWSNHLPKYPHESSDSLRYAVNKRTGYDILYIDHQIPEYDKDSGSLRTFSLLTILATLNHKITFWPIDLEKKEPYVTELQQRGIEVVYGNQKLPTFLSKNHERYKIVILSRPDVSVRVIDLVRKKLPQCKIIYDSVDLQFLSIASHGQLDGSNLKTHEVKRMHDAELNLMKKSNVTIFTSEKEQDVILKKTNLTSIIIPNIHVPALNVNDFEKREGLLFVGSFKHHPNIDTLKYLVTKILPVMAEKIPHIKLYIVGSEPTIEIQNMNSNKILVMGYVKDIPKFLNSRKVLVAPILYGAGVKGKISESLSYGLPVVTTSIGAEGMKLVDNENCMISDDPVNFANKVIQVYTDKELWEKLSKNGLSHAQNNYSPEMIRKTMNKLFQMIHA